MDALNRYSKYDYPLLPTLFLEFHGTPAGVAEQAEQVQAIAAENGGENFAWATEAEARTRLWQARHDALWADLALRPGSQAFPTDVCVPISRLAECMRETRADLQASSLIAPMVGHVGDGNFHVVILVDRDSPDEIAEARRLNDRMMRRALDMGGTCTGETGVGIGKKKYIRPEHGDAVDTMWLIKRAIDPKGIMNPGKVLPE